MHLRSVEDAVRVWTQQIDRTAPRFGLPVCDTPRTTKQNNAMLSELVNTNQTASVCPMRSSVAIKGKPRGAEQEECVSE